MTAHMLDIALYQVPGASAANMSIPANAKPPDFTVARSRNVHGVIARTSNDIREDPSFRLFTPAVKAAGLEAGGYGFVRPWVGTVQAHADVASRAIDAVGGVSLGWMMDVEPDSKVGFPTSGDELGDFMLALGGIMKARCGVLPGYWNPEWLNTKLGPALVAEVNALFDIYIRPAYPHQPGMPATWHPSRLQEWRDLHWANPPVDASQWLLWAQTTQSGDPGIPAWPSLPAGRPQEGWQMSSWGDRNDYGWPDPADRGLDLNVVTDDAWARWVAPPTIPEVPVEAPRFPYQYGARTVTLAEQMGLDTFKRLHPEAQRRFVGLQLACLVEDGVALGVGTAWRVQPAGQANHADPGKSYHEGCTVASKQAALAIDTVSPPVHEVGWSSMEKRLRKFGWTSFTIPQIPANYNIENRAYNGPWDRPHIQPYEVRYGRPAEAQLHGVSSPNLGPAQLGKWQIPAEYDLDLIDINDPLGGAVLPEPHPPQPIPPATDRPPEEDDMSFRGYYQLKGSEPGIWAAYDGAIKAKTWVCDLNMMAAMNGQLKGNGYTDAQLGLTVTDDVHGFRALGPILGAVPAGVDPFGIVLP